MKIRSTNLNKKHILFIFILKKKPFFYLNQAKLLKCVKKRIKMKYYIFLIFILKNIMAKECDNFGSYVLVDSSPAYIYSYFELELTATNFDFFKQLDFKCVRQKPSSWVRTINLISSNKKLILDEQLDLSPINTFPLSSENILMRFVYIKGFDINSRVFVSEWNFFRIFSFLPHSSFTIIIKFTLNASQIE